MFTDDIETDPHTPTTLDQENASYLLEQQVRQNVSNMNKDMDKGDTEDDVAFLIDILDKVQTLLQDAIHNSEQSPRKLQNWIQQVDTVYRPQLTRFPESEHLTNATQQFDSLLEDVNNIYDDWLERETQQRVHQDTEAMKKLQENRYKRHSKKRGKEMEKQLQKRLRITETIDSSESESDKTEDLDSEKEDVPLEITEEDMSTAILYKLIKSAKCTGFPRLKASSDLRERRRYFNAWQSDLSIVTSTVTATKDIFKEWPQSISDIPNHVNQALFNLVSSRCEAGPKAHIRACHGNGIKAITELQRHYAQITTEIIDSAMNRYQQLRQRNNETATSFIQRFDTIVDECRQLGEDFDSDKLLSRFMDALDMSSDTYKARIEALLAQKNMSQLNASLNPITLPYVQSQLLSIDEKRGLTTMTNGFKRYKMGDPYAMRATNNYTRTPYKHAGQSQKKPVKCGYKYCGKLGHTTFECRKKKRDEEYKAKMNKNPKNPQSLKPYSKANIRCHRCNTLGHYANECPNKKNENQQALRALVDTKIKHQNKNTTKTNSIEEMIMMAVIDPPTKWNTRPQRPPFIEITGFKDFLPDSGATSHFVSDLNDIQDPQPCDIEVTIADGNKVRATHVGQTEINFTTDNGTPSTLILANVYYIPGLSRRLFSLQSFTRDTPFSVQITHHFTRLHFGDGETYTWPISRNITSTDRYAMTADTTEPYPPNLERTVTTLSTRPLPLETSMARLGFRAAKGLLAGSLHRVWDDCHI